MSLFGSEAKQNYFNKYFQNHLGETMPEISIRVNPGSRIEGIQIISDLELHVKIRARPIEGEANRYLVQFLSEKLKISKSKIFIQKGLSGRIKKLRIDLDSDEWKKALNQLL